jgi:hypothetical protein
MLRHGLRIGQLPPTKFNRRRAVPAEAPCFRVASIGNSEDACQLEGIGVTTR